MPNEMIKELAEQANWRIPEGLPSDWDQGDYVVSPEQMQKFAKLVIKKYTESLNFKLAMIGELLNETKTERTS